jgi:dTDP-4-dehydrorhamnose 3,5-epimerase
MRFVETPLRGAFVVELELREDSRGSFARAFCRKEFEAQGLNPEVRQANLSMSRRKGTVRGMHYQRPPAAESKLVRCFRGAVHDVIVDLRPDSPSYLEHFAVELSADNRRALYVPEMFAHGCQTLDEDTELFYLMTEFYAPGQARGLRYDDPVLAIDWPLPVTEVSDRDASWPLLEGGTVP